MYPRLPYPIRWIQKIASQSVRPKETQMMSLTVWPLQHMGTVWFKITVRPRETDIHPKWILQQQIWYPILTLRPISLSCGPLWETMGNLCGVKLLLGVLEDTCNPLRTQPAGWTFAWASCGKHKKNKFMQFKVSKYLFSCFSINERSQKPWLKALETIVVLCFCSNLPTCSN